MIRVADLPRIVWTAARHRHARRDEIAAFQEAHLRRLVDHAYESVPRYRTLFERHGLAPHHIRTLADLARIPLTSRRDLQEAPVENVVTRGVNAATLLAHRTSGSTGVPLTIRRTWCEERLASAFWMRALRDFGVRPWHSRASIGFPLAHNPRDWDVPQRIIRRFGLYRTTRLDCRLPIAELVARLETRRPDVIVGSPGLLARIGQTMPRDQSRALRLRSVITGGEVLTPLLRRQITTTFGAPVHDVYATHELGVIGWQCLQVGTFHVSDDSVIVEVLKDSRPARPGETGEVIVTRLHAFAMPFIRYRLGDLVTQGDGSCACGAPFSTLLTVQGRMLDYFPLAGGRLLHPYELVTVIVKHGVRWVGQYQLTQERPDRVVARVMPLATPSPEEVDALEQAARACLGPGIGFQVQLLAREMPLEVNGKFRLARSLVESVYDGIDWEQRRAEDLAAVGRRSAIRGPLERDAS
ncbi:MAG TPA: hypothetical protein VMS64_14630 [Candidatus Methylomirabilis sp.]|nr:hypothetical protein [Candidatus Methylomirabilis sp.]